MKHWFLKREYPKKLTEKEMRKVKFCKKGIKKVKGIKGIHLLLRYVNQNLYLSNMN